MMSSTAVLLCAISQAAAWSAESHAVVAKVAGSLLRTNESEILQGIMGWEVDHDLIQDQLESVSMYADAAAQDWSKNYHIAHIRALSGAGGHVIDCGQWGSNRCLTTGLANWTAKAASPAASQSVRRESLKFVVHVVADATQPLHVGFFSDRGGHKIDNVWDAYTWPQYKAEYNLHELWDKGLFYYHEVMSKVGRGEATEQEARADLLRSKRGDSDRLAAELIKWLHRNDDALIHKYDMSLPVDADVTNTTVAYEHALRMVLETGAVVLRYPYQEPDGTALVTGRRVSEEYMTSRRTVMRHQLMKASVRLAGLLRSIALTFSSKQPVTTTTIPPSADAADAIVEGLDRLALNSKA